MACKHCSGEHWNRASHFPTPRCPLVLRLEDGRETTGTRLKYVRSYSVDPEFKDENGDPVKVVAWRYR